MENNGNTINACMHVHMHASDQVVCSYAAIEGIEEEISRKMMKKTSQVQSLASMSAIAAI